MTIAWVLGSRGLLGSAICRELAREATQMFSPTVRLDWEDEDLMASRIANAVREFAGRRQNSEPWEIYWAAGIGTMSSAEAALAPETRALTILLRELGGHAGLLDGPGALAFASSAGAIYAGRNDTVINEDTPPAATTAYARVKLEQEAMIAGFVSANPALKGMIARISTLYGPGQARGKQQGLLTHIARSMLRNQPVRIFVPLDTSRDYIAASDAARKMIAAMHAPVRPRLLTKIVASERPTTIAEIVSTFRKIARRAPRIITGTNPLSAAYPRCVRFRSIITASPSEAPRTNLLIGIAQVIAAERAALLLGKRGETR